MVKIITYYIIFVLDIMVRSVSVGGAGWRPVSCFPWGIDGETKHQMQNQSKVWLKMEQNSVNKCISCSLPGRRPDMRKSLKCPQTRFTREKNVHIITDRKQPILSIQHVMINISWTYSHNLSIEWIPVHRWWI